MCGSSAAAGSWHGCHARWAAKVGVAIDEVLRAKPTASRGGYLKKITVSTTTGPGIPVDPSVTRNFAEA
jgi:large subunit ribosomal protein L1